jgi:hypothetical protein
MSNTRKITYFVTLCLLLTISVQPARADTPTVIDDIDTVWTVGFDVNGYSCWSLQNTKVTPNLQVKIANKWVTKAKSKISKNSSLCSDPKYPWVALYSWKVDVFGETPHPGNSARDLMAREYLPKSRLFKGYVSEIFVKQVYARNEDRIRDGIKAFEELLSGDAEASSSGGFTSKFSGCTYKGKKLYGKVQVVDFLPDLKVQVVDFLPDLKVQVVDFLPSSCGKWQFVDFLPDLKIQFVDFLPDLKIQYVEFLPGLR